MISMKTDLVDKMYQKDLKIFNEPCFKIKIAGVIQLSSVVAGLGLEPRTFGL